MLATPKRVPVPTVVGKSISVGSQQLKNQGFKVEYVRDNSVKQRNTVIGQDPGGGTTADEGSIVTLTISDGLAITKVPDVVGLTRKEARRTLTMAGFQIDEIPSPSDTVKRNIVIAQSPSGNSQAEQNTPVKLQLSTGPERLPVPGVAGRTEDEARSALESAGFRVAVQEKEHDSEEPGTVLDQKPAAAARAARGSTVTIVVAIEPKQVSVPAVVGRTQNSATQTLSSRGFEVNVEDVPVEGPDEDGIVQTQAPASAEKVDRGATVTISVGRFDPDLNPDPEPTTTQPPATTTTTTPAPPPAQP